MLCNPMRMVYRSVQISVTNLVQAPTLLALREGGVSHLKKQKRYITLEWPLR